MYVKVFRKQGDVIWLREVGCGGGGTVNVEDKESLRGVLEFDLDRGVLSKP